VGIRKEILEKYVSKNFIETGTFQGDTIVKALECGFENIYSIEIDPKLHKNCQKRFADKSNVHLYLGDSHLIIPQILKNISAPSTFWLDAHPNGVSSCVGKYKCPILSEINSILNHNINHTLIIDDRHLFVGAGIIDWDSVRESQIMAEIKKHGRTRISYEDGRQPNNIIVVKMV